MREREKKTRKKEMLLNVEASLWLEIISEYDQEIP